MHVTGRGQRDFESFQLPHSERAVKILKLFLIIFLKKKKNININYIYSNKIFNNGNIVELGKLFLHVSDK